MTVGGGDIPSHPDRVGTGILPLRGFIVSARRLFRIETVPAVVVGLALAAAVVVFFIVPNDPALLKRFLPEQVDALDLQDSRPQRWAYQAYLLLLLLGGFALALKRNPCPRRLLLAPLPATALLVILLAIGIAVGARTPLLYLAMAAMVTAAYAIAPQARFRWIVHAAAFMFAGIALLPGVLGTLAPSAGNLVSMDLHYNSMFSQGRQLAHGHLLFADSPLVYGILTPVLIGVATQFGKFFSFGELVRIVQISQVAFMALLIAAAWRRARDAPPAGRAIALLLTVLTAAPWLSTTGFGVLHPNLSGYRFLMLPLAALVAGLLPSLPPWRAGALTGAVAGLALLHNLETGIAASCGLGIAWLISMRGRSLATVSVSFAVGISAFAATIGAADLLYRAFFAAPLFPRDVSAFFGNIGLFMAGFAGLPLRSRPVVLVAMLHASIVLVRALASAFGRRPAPHPADAAVATMLLVWMPYWVNRPIDENLWTLVALYALLIVPWIAAKTTGQAATVAAVLILLPMPARFIERTIVDPLRQGEVLAGWRVGCADGIYLPPEQCARLEARADAVRRHAVEGLFWSSELPLLTLHMSGISGPYWTSNLSVLMHTPASVERVARKIAESDPRTLMFDDPADPLVGAAVWPALRERLLIALPERYCAAGREDGWLLYRPCN